MILIVSRKKLCEDILVAFPCLTDNEIQNLFPKKETISCMKIVTHNGEICKLFCVAKIPMFFQTDKFAELFPTIYTLWHYPYLLYTFKTHNAVVSKLAGGAGLMLPGVILDGPPSLRSYGKLAKNTPVAVITEENGVCSIYHTLYRAIENLSASKETPYIILIFIYNMHTLTTHLGSRCCWDCSTFI